MIVLGVAGGIAAYKACELLRLFTEHGHQVRVVPTESALRFVGAATWEALSHQPISTDVWTDADRVPHVALGREASLVVVAPATADLLARTAQGRADDLLTSTLLTTRAPVLYAPAMHTEMWEHPATRANVATLRDRGSYVLEPAEGRLTGTDTGKGRLPDPSEIFAVCRGVLARGQDLVSIHDLAGTRLLVSAGGTREFLDPVRYLGNRSSGRQGFAIARAAAVRGAEVTLVAANTALPVPPGVEAIPVVSTAELHQQMSERVAGVHAVVMAAAPADFRPVDYQASKIKKSTDGSAPSIELTQNPDILAELANGRTGGMPVVAGFAAETGDGEGSVLEHGRAKLRRKGCDLLVVNEVGERKGFGTEENEAVILGADGSSTQVPLGSKDALAHRLLDLISDRI